MDPDHAWFLVFTLTTSLAGLFVSLFIIAVSSRSWWKEGSPGDVILSALGCCNVTRQIFLIGSSIIYCLFPELSLVKVFYTIFFRIYTPLSCCSSWMASWLCIFYCIKITRFGGARFYFVKSHFSKVMSGLMVASVLSSYLLISPLTEPLASSFTVANATFWETVGYLPYEMSNTALAMVLLWLILPFMLIVVSLALTLMSLTVHIYRMKKSACFSFPQIKGHLSAMTTMTFLLTLCMMFCFSQIVLSLKKVPVFSVWRQIGLMIHFTFTLVQAIVLVLGNPKLSSAFREIIKCQEMKNQEQP